jgi:hypothetical protein
MTINAIGKIRKIMVWCPNENIIERKSKIHISIENIMIMVPVPNENTVLWLSRLFGVLNLPVAFVAVIDIIGAFSIIPPHIPRTIEQLMGFLTALSAIAGAVVGLTARSHHSIGRKLMHMLISALGVVMIFLAADN